MIMYSLHPSQSGFAPTLVGAEEVERDVDTLINNGVEVCTRTFTDPQGNHVSVFWTTDQAGSVATLWEHTYSRAFGSLLVGSPASDSVALQQLDRIHPAEELDNEYAVGE